jgi:hypothetical protein
MPLQDKVLQGFVFGSVEINTDEKTRPVKEKSYVFCSNLALTVIDHIKIAGFAISKTGCSTACDSQALAEFTEYRTITGWWVGMPGKDKSLPMSPLQSFRHQRLFGGGWEIKKFQPCPPRDRKGQQGSNLYKHSTSNLLNDYLGHTLRLPRRFTWLSDAPDQIDQANR